MGRWQVLRFFPDDTLKKVVVCSHRWQWAAEWCSLWRGRRGVLHDVQPTPGDGEPGGLYWRTFDQLAHSHPDRDGFWLHREATTIVRSVNKMTGGSEQIPGDDEL